MYRRSFAWRTRIPLMHTLFTEKEQMLNLAMQYVRANCIPGDYLEFGCYEGNSFISAYHFSRAQGLADMRFFAFDSFMGLPVSKGIDQDPESSAQYYPGDFACDINTFRRNLRSSGVSLERVRLIEGFYGDSLTPELKATLGVRSVAVLMVDCDLYESTKQVLDFAGEYLAHGAVLIFDDWYNFKGDPKRGEQKAFSEWLERNPRIKVARYMNFSWHGLSFIVHHDDAAEPGS
jgi:O-methyltransferase